MRASKATRSKRYAAAEEPSRLMWRLNQRQVCMYCGALPSWLPLSVHEIERRSHASHSWGDQCNFLLLCHACHSTVFATAPHAMQLAVKWIADRENYDLEQWLRIRDKDLKAPNRVRQEEVDEWVVELQRAGLLS